jgi:sugar phosphate isomerase/epimerase
MAISRVLWASQVRRYRMREQIAAASAARFDVLSVAADLFIREQEQGVGASEILSLARDQGVTLDFLDGFCGWAPVQFADDHGELVRQVMKLPTEQCLDICGELGLKTIVTMPWFKPGALEIPLLVDCFARFCEQAARRSLQVDLEFTPIWGIADLRTAWEIVKRANCANSSITMDTWNFARGHLDLELLRELPAGTIVNVQLTDGYLRPMMQDPLTDSLLNRRMPGEGEFPLDEIMDILFSKGGVRTVGPEVFYVTDDAPPSLEAAQHAAGSLASALARGGR